MSELIEELIFRPIIACWQVLMAIMLPTKQLRLRRLQWVAGLLLLVGLGLLGTGISWFWFGESFRVAVLLFLSGFVIMLIASAIGYYIEKEILEPPEDDDPE